MPKPDQKPKKKARNLKDSHPKIPVSKITKNPDIKTSISKALEEVKSTPRQIIPKTKVTPYKSKSKSKTKNVNICISNPDISIKASFPQINTSKIHSSKLGGKKILSSKSTTIVQPQSSPREATSKTATVMSEIGKGFGKTLGGKLGKFRGIDLKDLKKEKEKKELLDVKELKVEQEEPTTKEDL